MIERLIIFHGQVQGVCFRAYSKQYAEELHLTGTVKNLSDGSVELVVQGEPSSIDSLIQKLQGPEGPGHVTKIEQTERPIGRSLTQFSVMR